MAPDSPVRVLFVCLGNICRSPMAEGIFRKLVEKRGLSQHIEIDSAGTSDWHVGEAPDPRAQRLLLRHDIDIRGLRGRQAKTRDFAAFDYILAMDEANHVALARIQPSGARARLFRTTDFAPQLKVREVPDPFSGDDETFVYVYDLIEASCNGLLDHIEREHLGAKA